MDMELVSLLYLLGNTMPGSRCIFLSRGAGDGKDHSQSSVASNTDNQLALEPNLASGTSAHHEGDPRIMAFGKKSGRHISLWGSDFAELARLGMVSRRLGSNQ